MPDGSKPLHDPSTGFHDIKPAPEFAAPPVMPPWLGMLLLLIIAGALFLKLRGRFAPRTEKSNDVSDFERLNLELTGLEEKRGINSIELREFAGRLSLALRSYLESQLNSSKAPFPAVDCTVPEVLTYLPAALRHAAQHNGRPLGSPGDISEIVAPVGRILHRCERLTFGDDRSLGAGLLEIAGSAPLGPEQLIALARQVAKSVEELIRPIEPVTALKPNSPQDPGPRK